jgi:hypothetical protein
LYLSLPCVGRLRTCAWMLLTMSSLLYRHSEKPNLRATMLSRVVPTAAAVGDAQQNISLGVSGFFLSL